MPADLRAFRERAACATAKADRAAGDADLCTRMADAVIAELAKRSYSNYDCDWVGEGSTNFEVLGAIA
jgi:hypothetical protein